jgi:hypothetical protein
MTQWMDLKLKDIQKDRRECQLNPWVIVHNLCHPERSEGSVDVIMLTLEYSIHQ